MDDDDDVHSLSAGTGSPEPNGGRITVTLASGNLPTPPPPTTTNPPPATQQQQQVSKANGGGGGGGGGREDCWSEGATGVLIDAWGERYLELSRGNLKQKHWKEVADIVSSREDYAKSAKTDIQCKNRIDTVKKKYKLEKAKIAAGGGPSQWPFFQQLDELIGPTAKVPTSLPSSNSKVPVGIPVGIRSGGGGGGRGTGSGPSLKRHRDLFVPAKVSGAKGNNQVTKNHQNLKAQFRKRGQAETESSSEEEPEEEEEEEEEADSDDSFPPEKRPRVVKREVNTGNPKGGKERKGWWGNSVRMLTQAILKFGEAYEQAESAKLQQVVEMEKARMKFAKELELQRMQFFMKTQMEISQLKHGGRNGGSGNATIKHPSGNNNVHNNNNNNNNNNINNSDSDNCD